MVRSWAYILMVAATLAGVVALVWPSPKVQIIEDIAMPVKSAPARAEPPAKPAKAASKPAKRETEPAPAPAAVVKKMPAPNTTTRRQIAQPDNGMKPSPLNRLAEDAAANPPRPPAPASREAPPRPNMPFKPGSKPERDPAAR
jgi:hypothetical protein